jgi:endonuclease/exonuclease/phosphatase family metal-dependent hydrolase
MGEPFRVVTINCRNTVDNWRGRRDLLLDQLSELDASVVGLQELRHFLPNQGHWIAQQVGTRTGAAYWLHPTWKTGLLWFWEGTAILTRLPIVERGSLKLEGQNRVAGFVRVRAPGGELLDFYNTHLASHSETVRLSQTKQIMAWMATRPGIAAVLVGDLNTIPNQPSLDVVRQSMRSVYDVLERPPEPTVPTPLRLEPSKQAVLDYIFVNDQVEVHDVAVAFKAVIPGDRPLAASDHYGLVATISVPAA